MQEVETTQMRQRAAMKRIEPIARNPEPMACPLRGKKIGARVGEEPRNHT
jgi:hypothetical protein